MRNGPDDEILTGQGLEALDTPALVVDADALARNLRTMSDFFNGRECRLRPHFKAHKCVTLALEQLAAGNCAGITCAKLAEGEHLVEGGVEDILIANQVVGEAKARRLAALSSRSLVRCAVDSAANVAQLSNAAREAGTTLGVLVEVDLGMHRCGVQPGPAVRELAEEAAAADGVRFDGLQGYEGHLVTLPDPNERRDRTLAAMGVLLEVAADLEEIGLRPDILSGGGTGTYDITGNVPGISEVQAGSYALMDAHYVQIRPEFRVARWVLATVISACTDYVVVDVGSKGLGCQYGPPRVEGHPAAEAQRSAEEHTVIRGCAAAVGERLLLAPSHGCTTNNLYREMWVARDGMIEARWPIEAAGALT